MVSTAAVPSRGGSISKAGQRPTPKRPLSILRKRNNDDTEDATLLPSSPTKRARVNFNEEVDVKVLVPYGKPPALAREEVRRALDRHARGDKWECESIQELYAPSSDGPSTEDALLQNYTAAIACHAAKLGRPFRDLVYAMLHSNWITRNKEYIAVFQRFLGNLASTQSIWLGDILGTLLEMFKKSPHQTDAETAVPSPQIRRRVHSTLQILLQLIPSASAVLATELSKAYPSPWDSRRRHVVYVRNILRITNQAPELQGEVLSLITSQLIKVDVQVQIDLTDLTDEVSDRVVRKIPQLKTLVDESDDETENESDHTDDEESEDPLLERARQITASIEKLDAIMDLLFDFYTRLAAQPQSSSFVDKLLLAQFSSLILPSYRSRHTQFLLFHFVQQSPQGIDRFAGALISVVFDQARPALVRESAAAYLASFVARGRHVSGSIVRDVFEYFGAKLASLREAYEPSCTGPDPRRYHTYYTLVQALLYIFCFRWRDLTTTAAAAATAADGPDFSPASSALAANATDSHDPAEDDDPDATIKLTHACFNALKPNVIDSPLNPLRVCAPPIVAEFALVALRLKFLYVYGILDRNRRVRLPMGPLAAGSAMRQSALASKKDADPLRLDAYFPFDPYRLPKSRRWVANDFREWPGVPGDSQDEESDWRGGESDDTATDDEG